MDRAFAPTIQKGGARGAKPHHFFRAKAGQNPGAKSIVNMGREESFLLCNFWGRVRPPTYFFLG